MKANELMIGDWVCTEHDAIPRQIDWIRTGEVGLLWNKVVTPPYLVPIPLTPEILEKNGFVQNPRSKSRRSHQICTDSVYISWWRGRINILHKPFVGHSTNHINCDVKYVHELQHVLRMAGIEKEIIL